ncbi:50S ribosomal protein L7/L12 [Patescibacteria group bacterium]
MVDKKENQPEADRPMDEKKEAQVEKTKVDEVKAEKPAEKKEKTKPETSGKFKDLIKQIEDLSVLELSELVKELEGRFGVSAAAPVAVVAPGNTDSGDNEASESAEKAAFDIELASSGEQKINVIKALREVNPDLGLKEAKDLVDAAPKVIKQAVKKEEAEEIKKKLESAGGEVNLK